METFQIQDDPEDTSQKIIEAKGGKSQRNGTKQIIRAEDDAKEKIARNAYPLPPEHRADRRKSVIEDPARYAEHDADEKNVKSGHWKSFFSLPFAPNFTEETSPVAAKFPLPSEKESTFSPLPSIFTFFPLTVRVIDVSENPSTLETPLIVIFLCCSIVSTLSLSSRMLHFMLGQS